ncbi:MAG: FAD-dependent monooxygenase, partial [Hyphomicrobiales bacterium]
YVIAADGIRSTVRGNLGIKYPGYELPETWSIADVDVKDWPNAGLFTICQLEDGKVVVVIPLEDARFRVVSNTDNALAALPLDMNVVNLRRAGAFTISVRQVEDYQKGRVFLAGDAAHCHSPVGGRGMNLGIADACDLAARLAEGTQDGYTDARHADGVGVIEGSERARKFVTSTNPLARMAFLGLLKTLSAFPALQKRFSDVVLYG